MYSQVRIVSAIIFAFAALLFGFGDRAVAASSPDLSQFANSWSKLQGYSATVQLFEMKNGSRQNAVYDYTFQKPQSINMVVKQGDNSGATVAWAGGTSATASKSGMFGIRMSKSVALTDPLISSLRGYTIADLGFGAILAHAQSVGGTLSSGDTKISGVTVTALTLDVANPVQDNGMTREVLYLSKDTELPVRVDGFAGSTLVRSYRFAITKTW